MKQIEIAFEALREIAARGVFLAILVAALPVLLLVLPFMLRAEDTIKDGEYWD